jgi:hypothetical protein
VWGVLRMELVQPRCLLLLLLHALMLFPCMRLRCPHRRLCCTPAIAPVGIACLRLRQSRSLAASSLSCSSVSFGAAPVPSSPYLNACASVMTRTITGESRPSDGCHSSSGAAPQLVLVVWVAPWVLLPLPPRSPPHQSRVRHKPL